MGQKQSNAQGEIQLVGEWLATLPAGWKSKTHVNVGAQPLTYAGVPLTPAQQRAFGVWNDWADARVVTPTEIWIVEGKLVATGNAYGQVLDYLNQYPTSADYQQFAGLPVVGVVLTMASRARTAALFLPMGIRTVVFQPSWSIAQALAKLFPAAQVVQAPSES